MKATAKKAQRSAPSKNQKRKAQTEDELSTPSDEPVRRPIKKRSRIFEQDSAEEDNGKGSEGDEEEVNNAEGAGLEDVEVTSVNVASEEDERTIYSWWTTFRIVTVCRFPKKPWSKKMLQQIFLLSSLIEKLSSSSSETAQLTNREDDGAACAGKRGMC